jgi:hypothetical protein
LDAVRVGGVAMLPPERVMVAARRPSPSAWCSDDHHVIFRFLF